jgi:hypothetical protein
VGILHTDFFLADKQVICVQILLAVANRLIALGVTVSVDETCVGWQGSPAASTCHCSAEHRVLQAGLAGYELRIAVPAHGRPHWMHGMQRMTLGGRRRGAFGITKS